MEDMFISKKEVQNIHVGHVLLLVLVLNSGRSNVLKVNKQFKGEIHH